MFTILNNRSKHKPKWINTAISVFDLCFIVANSIAMTSEFTFSTVRLEFKTDEIIWNSNRKLIGNVLMIIFNEMRCDCCCCCCYKCISVLFFSLLIYFFAQLYSYCYCLFVLSKLFVCLLYANGAQWFTTMHVWEQHTIMSWITCICVKFFCDNADQITWKLKSKSLFYSLFFVLIKRSVAFQCLARFEGIFFYLK